MAGFSQVTWPIRAEGISKVDAIALLMEFWTGRGFQEHQASLNRIVLRRGNYGPGSWIRGFFLEANSPWGRTPLELTALVQTHPSHVDYNMVFQLGGGLHYESESAIKNASRHEVELFVKFIDEWKNNDRTG